MIRAALAACLALGVAGCSASNEEALTVSAAASLTDAFTEIGEAFEVEYPGVEIKFNFAGSSTLAEQINSGAPVDIFAAASSEAMQRTTESGNAAIPRAFATNSLAIVTPKNNSGAVTNIADLTKPSVKVLVCAEVVPCGAAAVELFDRNNLDVQPVSLEPDVRAVLTKIIEDEADAGVVYRTDVAAAEGAVQEVRIADDANVTTEYSITTTTAASSRAKKFIEFVLSDEGRQVLDKWGFGKP